MQPLPRTANVTSLLQQPLMLKMLALLVLLLLVARPLYAADWKMARGKPLADTAVFVDGNSTDVEHDTVVKGWVKFEYSKPKRYNGVEATSHVTYRLANCETHRYRVMEDMLNVKNGIEPIRLEVSGNAQQWEVPPPGTEAEAALDALCYETRSLLGQLWDRMSDSFESSKTK